MSQFVIVKSFLQEYQLIYDYNFGDNQVCTAVQTCRDPGIYVIDRLRAVIPVMRYLLRLVLVPVLYLCDIIRQSL